MERDMYEIFKRKKRRSPENPKKELKPKSDRIFNEKIQENALNEFKQVIQQTPYDLATIKKTYEEVLQKLKGQNKWIKKLNALDEQHHEKILSENKKIQEKYGKKEYKRRQDNCNKSCETWLRNTIRKRVKQGFVCNKELIISMIFSPKCNPDAYYVKFGIISYDLADQIYKRVYKEEKKQEKEPSYNPEVEYGTY